MWKKLISHPKRLYFLLAVIVISGFAAAYFLNSSKPENSVSQFQHSQDQQMFYRIHQALGFFSAYVEGRCPGGLQKAKGLLVMRYDRSKNQELWIVMRKLMRVMSLKDKPASSELEALKQELHRVQVEQNYAYESAWAQEYENCILR